MINFIPGQIYHRRRNIHSEYSGQQQGGISTPTNHPIILIFTGDSGSKYGYQDKYQPDGVFWYTGEGQVGDMSMVRGNKAIKNHLDDGKSIALFEQVSSGYVRFIGWAQYLDHHSEERLDRKVQKRQAIIFELLIQPETFEDVLSTVEEPVKPLSDREFDSLSLEELRQRALKITSPSSSKRTKVVNTYNRSKAVKVYILKRADGKCEGCNDNAPFLTKKNKPYLEPHHTTRIVDGGPDHPANVIALCPNCHSRVHHSIDGDSYNNQLIKNLKTIEE